MEVESSKITKKLVAVGDGCCGKSALIITLAKGVFPEGYNLPTQLLSKEIEIDGEKIEMVLTDTLGQEDFLKIRSPSYSDTDVFLFCFSIAFPDSWTNIHQKWLPEVRRYCPKVPIILVGTKKDLRNDEKTIKQLMEIKTFNGYKIPQSPVTEEEGRKMSKQIRACCYLECSAKTNEGLKEVMETAARVALRKKPENLNCCVI